MSLKENYTQILKELKDNKASLINNSKYMRVLKNDLASILDEEVYSKMKTADGKNDKRNMSINTNFLTKIVNKLSQLYTFKVVRTFSSDIDIAEYYQKYSHMDKKLQKGVMFYNATKSVLLELYYDKKYQLQIRTISNDKYFLWTSDKIDTTTAEVVVKIMDDIEYRSKKTGKMVKKELYYMYSESEFLAVDSDGVIHPEHMPDGEVNPLGFLPFLQISKDSDELNAPTDKDTLSTLLQINSVLTDAVVANFYQAFPMIVASNIDVENASFNRNPNSVTVLNPKAGSDITPTIEVVASSLNASDSVNFSKGILELTMDSMGLKVNSGQASAGISSIQELISSADVTEVRKLIANDWAYGEEELWQIIAKYHNWLMVNKLPLLPKKLPKKQFSEDFEVTVDFPLLDTGAETVKNAQGNNDSQNVNKLESDKSGTNTGDNTNGEATEDSNTDTAGN